MNLLQWFRKFDGPDASSRYPALEALMDIGWQLTIKVSAADPGVFIAGISKDNAASFVAAGSTINSALNQLNYYAWNTNP